MSRIRTIFVCTTISFFVAAYSLPVSTLEGTPFVKNYKFDNVNTVGPQIWCILQDKRGMVYLGDGTGVVQFDGKTWTRIETRNNSIVRSMAIDGLGRIYVGGSNEFGYLKPGSNGQMMYVSLSAKIINLGIKFQDIWSVFCTAEGVFFFSNKYVFHYTGLTMKVIPVRFAAQAAYPAAHGFYLPAYDGVKLLYENRLRLVSKELFSCITRYRNNLWLVLDNNKRLCTTAFDGNKPVRLDWPVQELLNTDNVLDITLIDDTRYAITTESNKIIIISNHGDILQIVSKANGLINGNIYQIEVDAEKNLWVCTSNGVSKVDIAYPAQRFTDREDIGFNVFSSYKFKNVYYAGTVNGIFYLPAFDTRKNINESKFLKIGENTKECWDFQVLNNRLYALCSNGIWLIDGHKTRQIYKIEGPQKAHCFSTHPVFNNIFFVGMRDQVDVVKITDSPNSSGVKAEKLMNFRGISEKIRKIVCDKDGNLWMNTQLDGVYFVRFLNNDIYNYRITLLGERNGIKDIARTRAFLIKNELQLSTQQGLLTPVFPPDVNDPDSLIRFVPSKLLGKTIDDYVGTLLEVDTNRFLVVSDAMFLAQINGSKQKYDTCSFNRLNSLVEDVRLLDSCTLSICTPNGLINYDLSKHHTDKKPFNVVISSVVAGSDSVLFAGAHSQTYGKVSVASLHQNPNQIPKIDYANNSVKFRFSALFFEDADLMMYQYQLEGFDKQWSNWSDEGKATYTNLPDGSYTFNVRAQNAYGVLSDVATFSFVIEAPWYKTIWAFAAYILLVTLVLYFTVKFYTYRLIRQKEKLEKVIEERTKEIKTQSEELLRTNTKLLQLDRFKQRVTSMMVHDLKNPINAIINAPDYEPESQLIRIKHRGKQMLNLVLNMLDVYKYEEAEVVLNRSCSNLFEISQMAIQNINFLAGDKNITISNHIDKSWQVDVDYDIIVRVFENLLTNAIKYSPNNAEVRLMAELFDTESIPSFIKISVADNGIGIDSEKKHLIFDSFFQIKPKDSGSVSSTGLGLAYCKMAVNAHKGIIDVVSELNMGSVFWFTLSLCQNQSVVNQMLQSGYSPDSDDVILSVESFELIKHQISRLQKTEIYKITELSVILAEIDSRTNEEVSRWKEHLVKAIDSGNETLYESILKCRINR